MICFKAIVTVLATLNPTTNVINQETSVSEVIEVPVQTEYIKTEARIIRNDNNEIVSTKTTATAVKCGDDLTAEAISKATF